MPWNYLVHHGMADDRNCAGDYYQFINCCYCNGEIRLVGQRFQRNAGNVVGDIALDFVRDISYLFLLAVQKRHWQDNHMDVDQ